MAGELAAFKTRSGKPYTLVPLPFPDPIYDGDGKRVPATYANFLIINDAVLVPTYRDRHDKEALDTITQVFPERTILGIDCVPLIMQHGSLHCLTMQIPRGVL